MKRNLFLTTLLSILIVANAYCQDFFGSYDNLFITDETDTYGESMEVQEHRLATLLNHLLASTVDYPLEAREKGEQGLVRAVIFINPDLSKATLTFAKGNIESLEVALSEAYKKLNIFRFISDDYQGRLTFPIKISFELE